MLSPLASLANGIVFFLKIGDLPAELGNASSKCLHLDAEKSSSLRGVIIYERNAEEMWKTKEEETEVGARSSEPQKSYRSEYDSTQSSRAVYTGEWRKWTEHSLTQTQDQINTMVSVL